MCLYHGSIIDSSTFPTEIYSFIDSMPDNDDYYNDDLNMDEWFSLFNHPQELLPHSQEDEVEFLPILENDTACDQELKKTIEYWLAIASDNPPGITASSVNLIQECLDLFFANIVEEVEEESRQRVGDGERCLVPSLITGIFSSNKYLSFISNFGLRKPEPIL